MFSNSEQYSKNLADIIQDTDVFYRLQGLDVPEEILAETQTGNILISSSSVLPPSPGSSYRYDARFAFDGDPLTAWSEGSEGNGVGEYLEVEFLNPTGVDAIQFMPGFFDERWFLANNRVKKVRIRLFDEKEREQFTSVAFFDDSMIIKEISIGFHNVKRARFEIMEIYAGEKWNDLPISEIIFMLEKNRVKLGSKG